MHGLADTRTLPGRISNAQCRARCSVQRGNIISLSLPHPHALCEGVNLYNINQYPIAIASRTFVNHAFHSCRTSRFISKLNVIKIHSSTTPLDMETLFFVTVITSSDMLQYPDPCHGSWSTRADQFRYGRLTTAIVGWRALLSPWQYRTEQSESFSTRQRWAVDVSKKSRQSSTTYSRICGSGTKVPVRHLKPTQLEVVPNEGANRNHGLR